MVQQVHRESKQQVIDGNVASGSQAGEGDYERQLEKTDTQNVPAQTGCDLKNRAWGKPRKDKPRTKETNAAGHPHAMSGSVTSTATFLPQARQQEAYTISCGQYHSLPLRDPQISGLNATSVSQKQPSPSRRISPVPPFIKMTLGYLTVSKAQLNN